MTETGWLIEAADSDPAAPRYWRGSFGDERNFWTDDHMLAVRLARRQDAEAVCGDHGVLGGYAVRICEHGWMSPTVAESASQGSIGGESASARTSELPRTPSPDRRDVIEECVKIVERLGTLPERLGRGDDFDMGYAFACKMAVTRLRALSPTPEGR